MQNVSIDEKTASSLREQFDAARQDILGPCKYYHYPLLEIWTRIGKKHGEPLPAETLESIGISAQEFRTLHATGFAMETLRGGAETPERAYKNSYFQRHVTCLDETRPDAIGNLVSEDIKEQLRSNLDNFLRKNPEYAPK